jgi:hypothetical protein
MGFCIPRTICKVCGITDFEQWLMNMRMSRCFAVIVHGVCAATVPFIEVRISYAVESHCTSFMLDQYKNMA